MWLSHSLIMTASTDNPAITSPWEYFHSLWIRRRRLPRRIGARMRAAMAADAALTEAKGAFPRISGLESYDELHYALAGGALDDARRAKQAADAEKAQADAERAREQARAALANVNTLAGEVLEAKDDDDESERSCRSAAPDLRRLSPHRNQRSDTTTRPDRSIAQHSSKPDLQLIACDCKSVPR